MENPENKDQFASLILVTHSSCNIPCHF